MAELFLGDAWLLWGLGPLYLLWVGMWVMSRSRGRWGSWNRASVRFSSTARLRQLKPSWAVRLRPLVEALRLLTVALLVLAMARPQTGKSHTQVTTEGIDIFLVVDTSGSMQALDLDAQKRIADRRNRLEVVRDVMADFVKGRDTDQIGLVVFGSEAFTQCPLTLDHGIVDTFLERLEVGMAGEATAIGSALGTAVKRLRDSEAKSKVVVLLTDGASNAGVLSPKKAAEIAATFDIKVYTIGAGTRDEKAPVLVDGFFGQQVQYIPVELDEDTLQEVADLTGGAYFRAEDAEALERIYDEIDKLERTEVKSSTYMEYDERFAWLVLPAIALLLLELLLLGTRLRKVP
jgi:Ca-activated chloride channel family protein